MNKNKNKINKESDLAPSQARASAALETREGRKEVSRRPVYAAASPVVRSLHAAAVGLSRVSQSVRLRSRSVRIYCEQHPSRELEMYQNA